MTNQLKLTSGEVKRLERNLQRGMKGVEITPGAVVHVAKDVKPETIEALKELARIVQDMSDEDLKEVEVYADFLKSKYKKKVGRPRKARASNA